MSLEVWVVFGFSNDEDNEDTTIFEEIQIVEMEKSDVISYCEYLSNENGRTYLFFTRAGIKERLSRKPQRDYEIFGLGKVPWKASSTPEKEEKPAEGGNSPEGAELLSQIGGRKLEEKRETEKKIRKKPGK